jgi:hypothetical protein
MGITRSVGKLLQRSTFAARALVIGVGGTRDVATFIADESSIDMTDHLQEPSNSNRAISTSHNQLAI